MRGLPPPTLRRRFVSSFSTVREQQEAKRLLKEGKDPSHERKVEGLRHGHAYRLGPVGRFGDFVGEG